MTRQSYQNHLHDPTAFSPEYLAAVNMKKTKLYFNRRFNVGYLKGLMYQFHYEYMKQKYGVNAKLLFTDTLCYEVKPLLSGKVSVTIYDIDHQTADKV